MADDYDLPKGELMKGKKGLVMGVANGNSIAVMSVLDNLNKGAAGGAIQWMNRLLGIPETCGLTAAAPGWT